MAKVETLSERQWRDAILASLPTSKCASVSDVLRAAALKVRSTTNISKKDQVWADAAMEVLGPRCLLPDPSADSFAIAAACPLPKRKELDLSENLLRDIRAVDYALLNALASSLLAAGHYDESAQRLMMDFALSISLRGERLRELQKTTRRPR